MTTWARVRSSLPVTVAAVTTALLSAVGLVAVGLHLQAESGQEADPAVPALLLLLFAGVVTLSLSVAVLLPERASGS